MCYQNCTNENYHGDCKIGSYPENFICPHERAICSRCESACYWYDMDESGLCEECLANDIEDAIIEAKEQDREPYFDIKIGGILTYLTETEINTAIERLERWKKRRAMA